MPGSFALGKLLWRSRLALESRLKVKVSTCSQLCPGHQEPSASPAHAAAPAAAWIHLSGEHRDTSGHTNSTGTAISPPGHVTWLFSGTGITPIPKINPRQLILALVNKQSSPVLENGYSCTGVLRFTPISFKSKVF